jgi:hypothetical protein
MSEPDNWKSKVYNGPTSAAVTTESGNGITNNRPYISLTSFFGGSKDKNTPTTEQYRNCVDSSIGQRQRQIDTTAGSTSGIFGSTAATITTSK